MHWKKTNVVLSVDSRLIHKVCSSKFQQERKEISLKPIVDDRLCLLISLLYRKNTISFFFFFILWRSLLLFSLDISVSFLSIAFDSNNKWTSYAIVVSLFRDFFYIPKLFLFYHIVCNFCDVLRLIQSHIWGERRLVKRRLRNSLVTNGLQSKHVRLSSAVDKQACKRIPGESFIRSIRLSSIGFWLLSAAARFATSVVLFEPSRMILPPFYLSPVWLIRYHPLQLEHLRQR